jgi:hypothetical protein
MTVKEVIEGSNIPDHILKLQNIKGFTENFIEILSFYTNQEDAYEAVERIYFRHFQKRKYANFESFRQCRNRYYKSCTRTERKL